jgi:hypothetical protein
MNQLNLIRKTIDSHSDFPKVQADMRRILRLAESHTRMSLTPIINDEPTKAVNPALAALDASTEAFEASAAFTPEVEAAALAAAKAVVAQTVGGHPGTVTAVMADLTTRYADAPATLRYIKEVARYIVEELQELPVTALLALRKA